MPLCRCLLGKRCLQGVMALLAAQTSETDLVAQDRVHRATLHEGIEPDCGEAPPFSPVDTHPTRIHRLID